MYAAYPSSAARRRRLSISASSSATSRREPSVWSQSESAIAPLRLRSGIRTIADASELPPLLREASEAIAAIGTLDSALLFFLRTARIVPEDLLFHLRADGAAA